MQIINAWICSVQDNSVEPIFGDLTITDRKISKIEEKEFSVEKVLRSYENGKNVLNAKGKVVTIPFVNFHDHFYSMLAKGLPINGPMDNFHNILKNLWWKVDRIMDRDIITASAQSGILDSIKNGVTYIFDHHSSPDTTKGSLELIANVFEETGLCGVLCFETTNRNGDKLAEQGLEENKNFLQNAASHNVEGLLGLHASFTLSDKSLEAASGLMKELNTGIHIHVCEDKVDNELSKQNYKMFPVERLKHFNLLNEKSILSHGIHLIKSDYETIAEYGSAIAFNPDSNMNNAVGLPDFNFIPDEIPFLMGTDGMHSNTAKSLKQLFLLLRHSGKSFDESFKMIRKVCFDQIKFSKRFFPDFSSLQKDDRADIIIWDYVPPTPFTPENFWGHFIYGILESHVSDVIQNGKILMRDFSLQLDEARMLLNIVKEGNRFYNKFKGMK